MALKRGIDKAVEVATEEVKKLSKPVSGDMIADLHQVELGEQAGADIAVAADPAAEQPQQRRGEGCSEEQGDHRRQGAGKGGRGGSGEAAGAEDARAAPRAVAGVFQPRVRAGKDLRRDAS